MTAKGVPLALLVLTVGLWVSGRAAIWESPVVQSTPSMVASESGLDTENAALSLRQAPSPSYPAPQSLAYGGHQAGGHYLPYSAYGAYPYPGAPVYYGYPPGYRLQVSAGRGAVPQPIAYYPVPYPSYAPPPQYGRFARAPELGPPGYGYLPPSYSLDDISPFAEPNLRRTGQVSRPGEGTGLPPSSPSKPDRWMLDVFGFHRQGSSSLSIPQGPLPTYGASQLAGILQWRARPSSSHDPRIFLRAYQAQVEGGESEIAAGVSARPIGRLPVRLFGELRATRSPAVTDLGVGVQTRFRPAVYAATELPPLKLPMGFALETYGAAGYVAGSPSTYFLDGQAVATRELSRLGKPGAGGAVSIGGGVWGGAQRDAKRLDVGPTLRFDVDIGKMPTRVSVDYREQVAGDAEPDSGVAATVSTRF